MGLSLVLHAIVALIASEAIYHSHKGIPLKINGHFTCPSTFVVYVIKCPCGLQYVGQTSRMIKVRIREHKSAIKTKKIEQAVACHFIEKGHGVQQLKFQVVDGVPILHRRGDRLKELLKREAMWIRNPDLDWCRRYVRMDLFNTLLYIDVATLYTMYSF
ncbi:hypothetical protein XELAEV_18009658mg [Xenopus laevis]|uniref:GIY-YIG domain-containing protein n=1 Tax=Xenopus laevis TaxID=8355 RepID=A0A974DSS6_XENLA|nr:hypothetical protein XELAEV_18009658mg [Xenopus laevis]